MILKTKLTPFENIVVETIALMNWLDYRGSVADFTDCVDEPTFHVLANKLMSMGIVFKNSKGYAIHLNKLELVMDLADSLEFAPPKNPFNYERFEGKTIEELVKESAKMEQEADGLPLISKADKELKIQIILNNVSKNSNGLVIRFGYRLIPTSQEVCASLAMNGADSMKKLFNGYDKESSALLIYNEFQKRIETGISDTNHLRNIVQLAVSSGKYPKTTNSVQADVR